MIRKIRKEKGGNWSPTRGQILVTILVLALFLVSFTPLAQAGQVTLAWDYPDPSPDLQGFKIYYGTSSRTYGPPVLVGPAERTCTITGLEGGTLYFFSATSYTSQSESDYSEEISYLVPPDPVDSDGDGISDSDEINIYGTDPNNADTDGDGIEDGAELAFWGANWNGDYDGDGIINLLDYDSDNDGLSDGLEISQGYDPSDPLDNGTTVYEDAEHGTTWGWDIYDNTPSGAAITNVFDTERQSRVIQVSGSGTDNGYRLRNTDGSNWRNASQFVIEWSMNYSESFFIYIDVETSEGHRYLTYRPVNYDSLGTGEYVLHGLGTASITGGWRTFVRDLQADLDKAQPGVIITEVNGFLIRGSGRVDDIKLMNPGP